MADYMDSSAFIETVRSFLIDNCAWNPNERIIVAVSGGPDSVALLVSLCCIMTHPSDSLIVAHLDHQTRGIQSSLDAQFVNSLASSRSLRFVSAKITDSKQHTLAPEHFWRNKRYHFLEQVRLEFSARFIATGHTRDDQVETLLMRFINGPTGSNLPGIQEYRENTIVRPLLKVSRSDVIEFLEAHKQPFRSDSSNSNSNHPRNFIRHCIVPLIHSLNPSFNTSVFRLLESQAQDEDFFQGFIDPFVRKLSIPGSFSLPVELNQFSNHPAFLRRLAHAILIRLANRYTFRIARAMVLNLTELLANQRDRVTLQRLVIRRYRNAIWIIDMSLSETSNPVSIAPSFPVVLDNLKITLRDSSSVDFTGNGIKTDHDDAHVSNTYYLRHPEPFDVFATTKQRPPISLKQFLKKLGIPSEMRNRVPLLVNQNGQVCAIVLASASQGIIRSTLLPENLDLQWEIS